MHHLSLLKRNMVVCGLHHNRNDFKTVKIINPCTENVYKLDLNKSMFKNLMILQSIS